jgi:hypothetical protein
MSWVLGIYDFIHRYVISNLFSPNVDSHPPITQVPSHRGLHLDEEAIPIYFPRKILERCCLLGNTQLRERIVSNFALQYDLSAMQKHTCSAPTTS